MKKLTYLIPGFLVFILLCIFVYFTIKFDHHGVIGELNEEKDKFLLFPVSETENDTAVIYFNEYTDITGKINDIDDLKDGQEVKVWTRKELDLRIATKIKVIDE